MAIEPDVCQICGCPLDEEGDCDCIPIEEERAE